jgi:hypothetical protein
MTSQLHDVQLMYKWADGLTIEECNLFIESIVSLPTSSIELPNGAFVTVGDAVRAVRERRQAKMMSQLGFDGRVLPPFPQ